jgi:hypothetical protein
MERCYARQRKVIVGRDKTSSYSQEGTIDVASDISPQSLTLSAAVMFKNVQLYLMTRLYSADRIYTKRKFLDGV